MTMTTFEIIYEIKGAIKSNIITAKNCDEAAKLAYSKEYMPNDFAFDIDDDLLITITDEANQIVFDSSMEGHKN